MLSNLTHDECIWYLSSPYRIGLIALIHDNHYFSWSMNRLTSSVHYTAFLTEKLVEVLEARASKDPQLWRKGHIWAGRILSTSIGLQMSHFTDPVSVPNFSIARHVEYCRTWRKWTHETQAIFIDTWPAELFWCRG